MLDVRHLKTAPERELITHDVRDFPRQSQLTYGVATFPIRFKRIRSIVHVNNSGREISHLFNTTRPKYYILCKINISPFYFQRHSAQSLGENKVIYEGN